jgi:brefeldin A-resistance guanine nucleotide exchange factor 1
LHAFFVNGLIRPDSLNLEEALGELSHTVSHCKFEASDSSGDEVTLLKIMTVIEDCMTSAVGQNVGDIEICEMLETVLTTCCQMRLSETLRRAADNSMQNLVRIVFARLPKLDPTTEEAKLQTFEEESADALTMNVSQPDVIIDQERAAEVNGQPAGSEQVQEAEQQPPTSAPLSAGLSRSQCTSL